MSSNNKQIALPSTEGLTPDAIAAQEITDLTTRTIQWVEYGQQALEAGAGAEAAQALIVIRDNLIALLRTNALTPAILQAQAKALEEATAQYTKLAQKYEVVQATFDHQVGQALDETLEHLLNCDDCRDEVEIEMLANRMMDEGQDEIEAEARQTLERRLLEARQTLERRLLEARELAHDWKHNQGLDKAPGVSSNFTFQADPDPDGLLDEDKDDPEDEDDSDLDLLGDGNDEDEEN